MGYTIFMNLATAKNSVRPRKNTAVWGEFRRARAFRRSEAEAEWIKEAGNLPEIARENNLFAKKVGGRRRNRTFDLCLTRLPKPTQNFRLWMREGSNLRPLSYQDSVLPLNYASKILVCSAGTVRTAFYH